MLSDREILDCIRNGQLKMTPFEPMCVQPCSIDVRLDSAYRVMKDTRCMDVGDVSEDHTWLRHANTHSYVKDGSSYFADLVSSKGAVIPLAPGEFILGSTVEVIGLGDRLAARIEGKSSLGRLGISIHETAGFIDPGFTGTITLEIKNNQSNMVWLRPNMKIAQLAFFYLGASPLRTYDKIGHYNKQDGPTESRYKIS